MTLLMVVVAACSGEAGDGPSAAGTGGGGASGGTGGSAGAGGSTGGSDGSGDIGGANGGTGGSGGDPVEPPVGSIPMFIAQGHAGRTIISCDDGHTWVADQSDEAGDYCATNDCDHGPGAGRGITWGEGWFFATFGWGAPGSVRRSRDGVTWEPKLEGDTFGGMVFGNGRLVAADRYGQYSDDLGGTWDSFSSVELASDTTGRDTAVAPYEGGRFVMSADGGIVVSSDGSTWAAPQSVPGNCRGGGYQGRIIYGNGTIVTTPESGDVCYSTDGGQNWSVVALPTGLRANGIWNGSEFMAWNYGTLYRSTDAESWTTTQTVPNDIDIGVAAVSDQGTIVGVTSHWQQHYDSQVFYRSEDGVNWEVLPENAYTGGHPITTMTFGYGQPSEHCSL